MATVDERTYKVLRWLIIYREPTTIGQVVDVTGLDFEEAEGVLYKLKMQGLVVETQGGRRLGRRAFSTKDDMRTSIRQKIEEYEEAQPISPEECKPESPHYLEALTLLKLVKESDPDQGTLRRIEELLDFGRRYDSLGPKKALKIVNAYYDLATARLRFLQGRGEEGMGLRDRGEAILARYGLKPPK